MSDDTLRGTRVVDVPVGLTSPGDDSDAVTIDFEPSALVVPTWIGLALASLRHTRVNLKAVRRSFKITSPSVVKVQTCAHDLGFVDTMDGADQAVDSVADAAAHVQAALDACADAVAVLRAIESGDPIPGVPSALDGPSAAARPPAIPLAGEVTS